MKKQLILLHGALGAEEQLFPLTDLLEGNFEIHTINFSGHGKDNTDVDFSIDCFVKNLKHYLDQNKLQNVLVFGYSMGGYVALKLASKHPDYFEKIITLGTKFNWTKESAEREIKMLNPEKIEEKVPAFAKMLSELHTGLGWKTVMQKTALMMLDLGNGAATSDQTFQQIKTKCLLGVGDLDQMVTVEETMKIVELIPDASFYLLEKTAHPIDKINLNKLKEVMLDFV